jgi:hypothetical protein
VALALVANVNLRDSRIGRAWMAMREDESVAACAGIPIVRTKLLAYGTGAAFGGMAGAFLASYVGVVNPAQFEFSFSIFIFAMVVLRGLGSISGVVIGAIILSLVNYYLLPDVLYDLPSKLGPAFDLSAISSGIYGAILVVVMLLRPQGLVPARRTVQAKRGRRHAPTGAAPSRRRRNCGLSDRDQRPGRASARGGSPRTRTDRRGRPRGLSPSDAGANMCSCNGNGFGAAGAM